jgi:hypothetical protein
VVSFVSASATTRKSDGFDVSSAAGVAVIRRQQKAAKHNQIAISAASAAAAAALKDKPASDLNDKVSIAPFFNQCINTSRQKTRWPKR